MYLSSEDHLIFSIRVSLLYSYFCVIHTSMFPLCKRYKILKRREECDRNLIHVCRNHHSSEKISYKIQLSAKTVAFIAVEVDFTKTQNKGKESENSYRKMKRSRWTGTQTMISSIFGKSSHFPFHYFVLFVLRYFPFHVV